MAVLTPISLADALQLTSEYGLPAPRSFEGIAAGSVNSNFALEVGSRRLFLRLYEEQEVSGAERETALLLRLAHAGVPTPAPLRRVDGALVSVVRGKPAALFPWRDGTMRCQAAVGPGDASQVGAALARVHLAGEGERCGAGRFRFEDLLVRLDAIAGGRDPGLAAAAPLLREKLERTHAARHPGLPGGLTHGDLFRDNVLWNAAGEVSALLDFESACAAPYAYDLMVTVLSWCFGEDFDPRLARAMCAAYEHVRPLSDVERRGLLPEGCFAALRFTITRITDYALRTDDAGPRVIKDWRRFLKRFEKLESLGPDALRQLLGV
jgi:homoserine kinase type II